MSGAGIKGPQQGAVVKQKRRPDYSNDAGSGRRKMEKKSTLDFTVKAPQLARIKIGIRIRTIHDIESLEVRGQGKVLKLWKETDPFPAGEPPLGLGTVPPGTPQPSISAQCETVYSTVNPNGTPTGDTWFGFIAKYDPDLHGSNGFDTDLIVKNVDLIPDNGFEPVTIAFTTEGNIFGTDHYIVATSVLPGENSTFTHMTTTLGTSKHKKVKKTSKAKKAKSKKKGKKSKRKNK